MNLMILALLGLRIIPFFISQLSLQAAVCESKHRRTWLLWGTVFNIIFNLLAVLFADHLCFFSTQLPFGIHSTLRRYRDLLNLNGSYQDIKALIASSVICMCLSLACSFAIQIAFHAPRSIAARRNKAWSVLLVALWVPFMIAGSYIASLGTENVIFSEICKKTVAGMPEYDTATSGNKAKADGDNSYIRLYNEGAMTCTFNASLANANEPQSSVSIGKIVIPAHDALTVPLRYGRDLRLDDSEETTVLLTDDTGKSIDSVTVPPLGDGEVYRRDQDRGSWQIYRHVKKGNKESSWSPVIPAPVFSRESGFYDEPFELSILCPEGCRVYYTLDGSNPSAKSLEYTKPILIQDATLNENTYSMRTDVSAGFDVDRIRAKTIYQPPNYKAPDFLIDKCTVVRAICVDAKGNRSDVINGSYFIDFKRKSGYDGMNVVSIITNPANLFSYNKGIYVTGEDYDDYQVRLDAGESLRLSAHWWWWGANYRRKGPSSERAAWIELFDSKRDRSLSKKIGIRIQGGGSRGYIPRSFNLYARKKYDNASSFEISIGDSGFNPQRMTLFSGGDAFITKLEDYLMSRFVSGRSFATMAFMPCVLFLNGEYWGNYWMTEKYDEEYIAYYYKVDRSDIVMIKNKKVAEGTGQDKALYTKLNKFISGSDMTSDENFSKACEMIDIDSFIDYYAVQAYIGRCNDWPKSNFAMWRTRSSDGGKYSDGRWRWMLFDDNSGAFSAQYITDDSLQRISERNLMFSSLMKRPSLQRRFIQTLKELAVDCFNPERVKAFISDYKAAMSEPLRKEYARFYGSDNTVYEDSFLPKVNDIENFLLDRYEFILEYCDNYPFQFSQPIDDAEGGE